MPNTSTVTQFLPSFTAVKNGSTANELKTNNGFNQILKNEVANKIKKTSTNNTKQLATDQAAHEALSQKKSAVNKDASQSKTAPSSINKESKELENINLSIIDETNTLLNFVGDLSSFVRPTDINPEKNDDAFTESAEELNVSLNGLNVTTVESTLASNNASVDFPGIEANLSKPVKENSIKSSDIANTSDVSRIRNDQSAVNTLNEPATDSTTNNTSSTTLTATSSNLISSLIGLEMPPVFDDKNRELDASIAMLDTKTQSVSAASKDVQLSTTMSQANQLMQEQKNVSNNTNANSSLAFGALDQKNQSDLEIKPAPGIESANAIKFESPNVPVTKSIRETVGEVTASAVNRQNMTVAVDGINTEINVSVEATSDSPIDTVKNLVQTNAAAKQTSEANTEGVEPAPVPASANSDKIELSSASATKPVQETSEEVVTNTANRQNTTVAVEGINKGSTGLNDPVSPTPFDTIKDLIQAATVTKQTSEVNTEGLKAAPVSESANSSKIELAKTNAVESTEDILLINKEVATTVMDVINKEAGISDDAAPPIDLNKNLIQASTVEKLMPSANTQQLESVSIAARALSTKTTATPADESSINNKFSGKDARTEQISDQTAEEYRPELTVNEHSASNKFSMALKTQLHETQKDNLAQDNKEQREFKIADVSKAEPPHAAPPMQIPAETASVSAASNFIGSRVGSRAWDQAIGQKIVWMVAGGEQSAQLTLNPPDLGPIQVVLSISDSQVDASFISSHLDVREAIEAAAPKLREMMDNAGMSLSGFSVNAQSTPSGGAFSSNDNNRNSDTNQRQQMNAGVDNSGGFIPTTATKSAPLGLVDTFV